MTNFSELAPVPSDRPARFTDQLRLVVAAYLARYKGSSREHAESDLRCYVAMLGLLGLRIFEATGADIADLGEEHGHRVLRVCGKGTKVVLVPLPPAVGRAIDTAVGARTSEPILLNSRGVRMDRHAATRRLRRLSESAAAGPRRPPQPAAHRGGPATLKRTHCRSPAPPPPRQPGQPAALAAATGGCTTSPVRLSGDPPGARVPLKPSRHVLVPQAPGNRHVPTSRIRHAAITRTPSACPSDDSCSGSQRASHGAACPPPETLSSANTSMQRISST